MSMSVSHPVVKAYSFWDSKYAESDSSGKGILDSGAQKWFGKRFTDLDEEDQQRVVSNEGYHHGDHVNTKSFEQKAIGSQFEIEVKDGRVVSTKGVMIDTLPDLYRDVCTKSCLKDMVAQLNERVFTMDLEHDSFRGEPGTKALNVARIPISKIVQAEYRESSDGVGQVAIKDSLNTSHHRFNEVSGSIANGYLHSYSIAFVPEKVATKSIDGTVYRFLGKVNLLNVTYTGVPVNPRAVMEGVVMKSKDEISRIVSVDDLDFKDFSTSKIEAKSVSSETKAAITYKGHSLVTRRNRDGSIAGFIDGDEMGTNDPGSNNESDVLQELKRMVDDYGEEETKSKRLVLFKSRFKEVFNMNVDVSLKDLSARIAVLEKENASLKAQLESKAEESSKEDDEEEKKKKAAAEAEGKALASVVADLKAQIAVHEKILNTPFVKGARSQMEADLKAQVETVKRPNLLRTM